MQWQFVLHGDVFLYMWHTFGVEMIKIEFLLKPENFQKELGESLFSYVLFNSINSVSMPKSGKVVW